MGKFYTWLRRLSLVLGLLVLVGCIFWTGKKHAIRTCQAIDISIIGPANQQLVEKQELLALCSRNGASPIIGILLHKVSSRTIEERINSHNFVRKSTVYKNWKGKLKIAVLLKRPIARIIYPDKPSQYIDDQGGLVPLSVRYKPRMLLIDGENLPNFGVDLGTSAYGLAFLKLLKFIDQNPFWRSQIIHIRVDRHGKLLMTTQLSKQKVVFGKPENIEKKMQKLWLFYKIILPYKGWNTYQEVKLEFDNQIVCE